MDYPFAHLRLIDDDGDSHLSANAIQATPKQSSEVLKVKYDVVVRGKLTLAEGETSQDVIDIMESDCELVEESEHNIPTLTSSELVLNLMRDREVLMGGGDPNRAKKTLPDGLVIKRCYSLLQKTRQSEDGVFTSTCLPDGVAFGPYVGRTIEVSEFDESSRYCWKIREDSSDDLMYLDSTDESSANWMRYIRFTEDASSQNIQAFLHNADLYFATTQDIAANVELLLPNNRFIVSGIFGEKVIEYANKIKMCDGQMNCVSSSSEVKEQRTKRPYVKKIKPITVQCDICGLGFSDCKKLNGHKLSHEPGKPYKCATCPKTFALKANLRKHLKIHSEVKAHKCVTCGKGFSRADYLKAHITLHTGQKPFACSICGRTFSRSTSLHAHKFTHVPKNGGKSYNCEECDSTFKHLQQLRCHARKHRERPYQCTFCEKRFLREKHLDSHIRMHSSSTPYKCCICETYYRSNNGLVQHTIAQHC